MKQNKKYRALKRLIGKITKSNAPLNNSFSYYNYTVGQYSGTCDYTDVTIVDFKGCYDGIRLSITDEALNEEIKELENTFVSYSPDSFDKEEYEEMLKQLEDLKKERNNL